MYVNVSGKSLLDQWRLVAEYYSYWMWDKLTLKLFILKNLNIIYNNNKMTCFK